MRIELRNSGVCIRSPAKVNLFLEVLGQRTDGYHEIETVMCPVSLFDELTVEPCAGRAVEFDLQLPKGSGNTAESDEAWGVPSTEDNLVIRAIRAVQAMTGLVRGCRVALKKKIPSSAGLGGGSSDAASAVVGYMAINHCWDRNIATSVCRELGSDIPFFLGDEQRIGLALATGRGESCALLSFSPALELMILHPVKGCETQEVYVKHEKCSIPRSSQKIVEACKVGQFQKIGAELFNALQFAACKVNPWIVRQLDLLAEFGFQYSLMTGSGSSCFAITNGTERVTELAAIAAGRGIPRCYSVRSWFAPSIEEQLLAIGGGMN